MSTVVGTTLPDLVIEASVRNIVATAIASRDYQDVHHDVALAQQRGSKTIFTNILTSNGYVLKYDTDRGGYVVPLDKESLSGAPRYSDAEVPTYTPEYSRRVNDYYGGYL